MFHLLLYVVNMFQPDKTYYSIKEFAALVRVHPNTIRNAIKSGRISAFRVGFGARSAYRIAASEIQRIALFDLEDMINRIIENREHERTICP